MLPGPVRSARAFGDVGPVHVAALRDLDLHARDEHGPLADVQALGLQAVERLLLAVRREPAAAVADADLGARGALELGARGRVPEGHERAVVARRDVALALADVGVRR